MTTVADIWEALIASENMEIKLRAPTEDAIGTIKQALSKYKYKCYREDSELRELLGDFKLTYEVVEEDGKWILTVRAVEPTNTNYDIEIIEGDD